MVQLLGLDIHMHIIYSWSSLFIIYFLLVDFILLIIFFAILVYIIDV